jgi:hypothetical protein
MSMKKNIKPYNYEDKSMPCCVRDSYVYGEISEDLKQLIDERLTAVENGTMEFFSNETVEQECRLRLQSYQQKQHIYV